MIGRAALPAEYSSWNARWGAPHGRPVPAWMRRLPLRPVRVLKARGPFALQPNTETRRWEYPWAYHCVPSVAGMRVLELGGALSGFQVTLARAGASVVNVDPFVEYGNPGEYRQIDPVEAHRRLCRVFGASVELLRSDLPGADVPEGTVDVVFSISTLEHLSVDDAAATVERFRRLLRPGGRCVLTVDLFLDIAPFTTRSSNPWGTNLDIQELVGRSGLRLVEGERSELYGFPEFDHDRIQSRLSEFLIGSYPGVAQCLVLEKPAR